jgi:hypothetical protein
MKNLKIILVFLVFAGVASCSSDDDSNGPAEADRIVGEWEIQSLSMDGEDLELSDCELQTRIRFSANGDITVTDYYEDFDSEECVSEIYNQKWEYRGNNVYRITSEEGSNDLLIVFSNNNNTFSFSREDEDGSYSATYTRV